MTDVMTTTSGAPIVQPPDQNVLGNLIQPGSYSSIKYISEDDECVGEDATSGITLDGETGGQYSIAVTPTG
jgi:hypothetical protein